MLNVCPDCCGRSLTDGRMPTGEQVYYCPNCRTSFYTLDDLSELSRQCFYTHAGSLGKMIELHRA